MAQVASSVEINAPAATVFAWIDAPEQYPRFWPNMKAVSNLVRGPSGGYDFDWTYNMAGIELNGHTTVSVFEPYSHIVAHTSGMIDATFEWWFSEAEGVTRLDLQVTYNVPDNILGRLAGVMLEQINQRDADTMLTNLKALVEGA